MVLSLKRWKSRSSPGSKADAAKKNPFTIAEPLGGTLHACRGGALTCEWVRIRPPAPAAKPGDDLLFHRLSDSTIGAVRFHGRVRDGIGWVTDAMVTKLWSRRLVEILEIVHLGLGIRRI